MQSYYKPFSFPWFMLSIEVKKVATPMSKTSVCSFKIFYYVGTESTLRYVTLIVKRQYGFLVNHILKDIAGTMRTYV